jgi:exodeoxyribonuclease-3
VTRPTAERNTRYPSLVTGASIHRNERKGDAPSEHLPVVVNMDVATDDDDDRPMIF